MRKHYSVFKKLIRERRFITLIVLFILTLFCKLISYTYRYKVIGKNNLEKIPTPSGSYIYAFWHQNIIPTIFSKGKHLKAVCLVSGSNDGDLIAYPCESFKMEVIRGSSGKASISVKREFERKLLEGYSGVLAIDGPTGPALKIKYGAISFSSSTRIPIIPYRAFSSKYEVLPTWDRMRVPIPFSTIYIVYGEPVLVEKNVRKDRYGYYVGIIEKELLDLEDINPSSFKNIKSISKWRLK